MLVHDHRGPEVRQGAGVAHEHAGEEVRVRLDRTAQPDRAAGAGSRTGAPDRAAGPRSRSGQPDRGVSAFVDRALQHEVARADLRSLLDELETELGPADPVMLAEAEAMLARLEKRARAAAKRRAAG